jgi:hypothetical protein
MEAVSPQGDCLRTEQTTARMSAYLRCLGLPPDHAETQAKAVLDGCASQAGMSGQDLTEAAIVEVMARFDGWLEYLCENKGEGSGSRDILAWHLRPVLAENPSLFLRRGEIPESIHRAVRAAAQPPVPEETPASMPAQSFGEAPVVFRASSWRGLVESLRLATRRMGACIRRMSRHART